MFNQPLFWHSCGIGLLLLLVAVHLRTRSSGLFLAVLWNLTGVILHELAHLLAGLLFGAGPVGFSIFPRCTGGRWSLGRVSFSRVTAISAVPIALAPLGLLGVAYLVATCWFSWFAPSLATTLGLYLVVFILLYNALPSGQDLRVACNWRSLLLYGTLILLVVVWYAWPYLKVKLLLSDRCVIFVEQSLSR